MGGGDNRMRRHRTPEIALYPRWRVFPIDFQGFLTAVLAAIVARDAAERIDNDEEEAT